MRNRDKKLSRIDKIRELIRSNNRVLFECDIKGIIKSKTTSDNCQTFQHRRKKRKNDHQIQIENSVVKIEPSSLKLEQSVLEYLRDFDINTYPKPDCIQELTLLLEIQILMDDRYHDIFVNYTHFKNEYFIHIESKDNTKLIRDDEPQKIIFPFDTSKAANSKLFRFDGKNILIIPLFNAKKLREVVKDI